MESLNKKELGKEIKAIDQSIEAHEAQMKLHIYAIKVDSLLRELMQQHLNSLDK